MGHAHMRGGAPLPAGALEAAEGFQTD